MHVELFKALKSVNVDDSRATIVVAQLEDYIVRKVEDANKAIVAQLRAQTWVIGAVGVILAIIGLAPAFTHLFHWS